MRINKYISETGICSRREADKLLLDKRVTINGSISEVGSIVRPGDIVKIDNKPIGNKMKSVYIALNKPTGIISTTERHVNGNIIDFINYPQRIFPIGRLDKDSEGLILLTNDGDIVNKILRSENNHEKEYIVTVNKPINSAFIKGMANGVSILGQITKPCVVEGINEKTFRIILTQGLNRQIRRMSQAFGYRVIKLKRIRIMNITLKGLKTGEWRYIKEKELKQLTDLVSRG
ncbi:23S rRNA pseudouridine(2604) synthase RluF [Alkaliphilus pronyensis]|uniref:Pseudouridine synthase n=1 Tax=Alkaliphilus pronyensis TaxID=1482732 RepID=A0A6I0FB59_9FIRM|nr:23S rRNA pseudouridine(2604) synthase RluF [Alkaliphilus pronyensis]KAB3536034.1 23S rRNA pseudouridine(2604) synthase RluF [Alkaliphilus pronyensis]